MAKQSVLIENYTSMPQTHTLTTNERLRYLANLIVDQLEKDLIYDAQQS